MIKTYQLEEYADVVNGGAWSENEYSPSGICVVKVTNMVNGTISESPMSFLPLSSYEKYKAHKLVAGDLVLATVGSHPDQPSSVVGKTAIIPAKFSGALLNQNAACIRIKDRDKVNSYYLKFLTKTILFKHHIESRARGSANQVRMAIGELKKFTHDFPCLNTQKKIAAILSAYDDLIENNTRRIALLERMAEELYKEWFVRMRFPVHEQTRFVKGIPEGWEVKKLGEITSLLNRGISPKYDDESSSLVINQKCIRDGKIDLAFAKFHSSQVQPDKIIQFGDTLINSTGVGTLGRAAIATEKDIGLTVDSHVTICRAKPELANNLYLGYTVRFLQNYFEYMAVGATGQVELLASFLKKSKILLPDCATQSKFGSTALHLINQQTKLAQSNLILKQTRDRLLTRMISGKLSVEDLDIAFPPSMLEEV